MKIMNWHNLRRMQCPYCDNELVPENAAQEMRCSSCTFHMAFARFYSIVEHRGPVRGNIRPMRWQNVRDDKCPVDGFPLTPAQEGALEALKCTDRECDFKITEMRLQEILHDPQHPANRYYKAVHSHGQRN